MPCCAAVPFLVPRQKELVGPLIAPARTGFAHANESPLLVYTRCQGPAASPCCRPVLAQGQLVVPKPRHQC